MGNVDRVIDLENHPASEFGTYVMYTGIDGRNLRMMRCTEQVPVCGDSGNSHRNHLLATLSNLRILPFKSH